MYCVDCSTRNYLLLNPPNINAVREPDIGRVTGKEVDGEMKQKNNVVELCPKTYISNDLLRKSFFAIFDLGILRPDSHQK